MAVCLAGLIAPAAAFAQPAPPTLDCNLGFTALQAQAQALPGAQLTQRDGFEIVTQAAPDLWRVEFFFTTSWHPAQPAAAVRTFRKQVTGVWTAESKACGYYGNQQQFAALVDDLKAGDKELTDASRAEVERNKRERSPLATTP
jgi:hypothetical protein